MRHSDQFLQDRLLWAMKQGALPDEFVQPYPGIEPSAAIRVVVESADIGIPVVSTGDPERFTVIGTRGIVSSIGGVVCSLRFDDVVSLEVWDRNLDKQSQEYLRATDAIGNRHRIWFPPGRRFFTLWNTIQRFIHRR